MERLLRHNKHIGAGRTHTVFWCALGSDELDCSNPKALNAGSFIASLERVELAKRPKVIAVCMRFGAKRVAAKLHQVKRPMLVRTARECV